MPTALISHDWLMRIAFVRLAESVIDLYRTVLENDEGTMIELFCGLLLLDNLLIQISKSICLNAKGIGIIFII